MPRMLHRNVVAGSVALALSAGLIATAAPLATATTSSLSSSVKVATVKKYAKKSPSYKKYRTYKKYRSAKKYSSYKRYKSYKSYRSYRSYRSTTSGVVSGLSQTSGNRYYRGYCTWYAYERRMQMGRPVGGFWHSASAWVSNARAAGYDVNRTPALGAVMVKVTNGSGHVAVVESVADDGSITISEMNYAGFNRVSTRTLSAAAASAFYYIH